ncbi:MAG: YraN family protein [Bacteroidales bacterium]|nr:YraN family protein [Bacteroidales bacterium]MBQ2109236.1 YraN family protein [Bacteroidales bacterium]MBQ3916613.1 YraN family protein [Bacteroidales bacterium]
MMEERGRKVAGNFGEDAACRYLEELGHTILERNWRGGHLELDIISLASDGIHFVEVKTRVAPVSASPEENVGRTKQRRMVAAANKYLNSANGSSGFREVFFDVVAVTLDGGKTDIEYFPSAFVPLYY